jgi:hypothetical protein
MQFLFEPGTLSEQELRDELGAALEAMREEPGWGQSVLILARLPARDGGPARRDEPVRGGVRLAFVELVRDPAAKGAVAAIAGLLLREGVARITARRGRSR